jgi:hypothetical protein
MAKQPAPNPSHESPVPDQLKKQIAEAEAIRKQMSPEAPNPGDNTPPEEPAAETPPAAPPPSPAQPELDESWEQKFRSQAGRMEQLVNTNRALNERLNQLDDLIIAMQAKGAEAPNPNPPPAPAPKTLITDQERTDYGDELLTVVGKRAREEYAPEFEQLASRLAKLEGRVEGVGQVMDKTQQQDVYAGLDQHVTDWREINKDANFKAWLAMPDPYSGRVRHDMLKDAFSRHETGRVVAFFRGFLTEAAGLPPNPPSPGLSAPHPNGNGNGSGRPSLEDFAAPGRARSAPQPLSPDKPMYTSAQIAQFFADKRVGKYKGREAQADQIERDIFQAQHEGRIQ